MLPRRFFALPVALGVGAAAITGGGWWLNRREPPPAPGSVLRLGYAVEPPFAWVDGSGRVTGEAPELARLVMARMGNLRPSWQLMGFDQLVPALESDRIDVVAAGLSITPERAQRVRFSRPTLRVQPGLLMRAADARHRPGQPMAYAQLARVPGLRVAVLAGSVEARQWLAQGLPAAQLVAVPDGVAGQAAVRRQAVDVLSLSLPTVRRLAAESAGALVALPVGEGRQADADAGLAAFAFAPGAGALHQAWDRWLATLVGGAEHLRLLKAVGLTPDDLPGPRPAAS